MPQKIKTKKLLVSGDSWMASESNWYEELFDSDQVTNLAVPGSGNKYIAESVMSHIIFKQDIDFVFVNWSGLVRIDIPMPLKVSNLGRSQERTTANSKYWTNIVAPWRDKSQSIHIEEKIVRMMYQEKDYANVKSQSLLNVINLQNFLKVKQIPYLFCFLYDYKNKDFDHNHLVAESQVDEHGWGVFSTLGSVEKDNPILAELDRQFCLEPTGMDWGLRQSRDVFRDGIHLTKPMYREWAKEMLLNYQTK